VRRLTTNTLTTNTANSTRFMALVLALTALAPSTAVAQSQSNVPQSSTSAADPATEKADACWDAFLQRMKECKDEFCPNALFNCDSSAYADCRSAARWLLEQCMQ